jgi:DNA-binding transcriptional ArsR family regulator
MLLTSGFVPHNVPEVGCGTGRTGRIIGCPLAATKHRSLFFDMNLSDPTQAVGATLDGAVLAVLASSGRPLTVGQVAGQAARGSEIGIRRTLARLAEQGIVRGTMMGRNQVYELNRDHIAAHIAELMAELRPRLWDRFRGELADWRIRPLYACVFGSAARGDGDPTSDIDLLLVHPPLPGEKHPAGMSHALVEQPSGTSAALALARTDPEAARLWGDQIDRLRGQAHSWTGNALQVLDRPCTSATTGPRAPGLARRDRTRRGGTGQGSHLVRIVGSIRSPGGAIRSGSAIRPRA